MAAARTPDELADRAELIDLVARYAQCVDDRHVPGIVACFTDDAHVELDGGAAVVDGHDQLAAFFEQAFLRPVLAGVSTHVMSNILVTLDGDRASVETHAVAYLAGEGSDVVVARGLRYSDGCVRQGDRWLVRHRIHRSVWQGELARTALQGIGHRPP